MDIVGDESVHNQYGVFLGLDVGKSDHHAVALDPAGKRLHDAASDDSGESAASDQRRALHVQTTAADRPRPSLQQVRPPRFISGVRVNLPPNSPAKEFG